MEEVKATVASSSVRVTTLDCAPVPGDVVFDIGGCVAFMVLHPNNAKPGTLKEGEFLAIMFADGAPPQHLTASYGYEFESMREKGKLRRLRQMKLVSEHGESPGLRGKMKSVVILDDLAEPTDGTPWQ